MYNLDFVSRFEDYLLRLIWGAGFERGYAPSAEVETREPRRNAGEGPVSNLAKPDSGGLEKKTS